MFPFFLFGGFFTKFLDDLFRNNNANPQTLINIPLGKYVNHVVSDSLLNVKFGIEENYKLKTSAYQDDKGVWTIGIGVVNVFDDNLNFVLKVYKNLTLTQLKLKMGKSHLSDLQFTFNLMRNHVRKSKSYTVFKDLDSYNIPYNSNLADAIIDFYYNSGSAYGTSVYYNFIAELRKNASMAGNSNLKFAIAYVRYRLGYLESWSPKIYGSWIRRVQIFADRILTNDQTMENNKSWRILPTSVKVKNYIAATYFYNLRKPLV